jgi:Galactose binding lectin domain/Domain of unknown function (DUF4082)
LFLSARYIMIADSAPPLWLVGAAHRERPREYICMHTLRSVWLRTFSVGCSGLALIACAVDAGGPSAQPGDQPAEPPSAVTPADETASAPVERSTSVVGPEGGSIQSADAAVAIDVPADSLPQPLELSLLPLDVNSIPRTLPLPLAGGAVELTPHGTLFAKPTTIRLPYDTSVPVDQLQILRLNDENDQIWEPIAGATFNDGVAEFQSHTFSLYAVAVGSPSCWPQPGTSACGGACGATGYCTSASANTSACGSGAEGSNVTLTCPAGQVATRVAFASYGTPTGACGSFVASSCNSTNSVSVVSSACLGKATCTVAATNTGFGGDPCAGTYKRLNAQLVCSAPATSCVSLASNNLCGNLSFVSIADPAFPDDVTVGRSLASALVAMCPGATSKEVAPTDATVQNQCTGESMLGGGKTLVIAGGPSSQRMVLNQGATVSPVWLDLDDMGTASELDDTITWARRSNGGVIVRYPFVYNPTSDYFAVQLYPDPIRGALVFSAFGNHAVGTRAANWYVQNVVLAQFRNNTRPWKSYVVMKWTDLGTAGPDASDTWTLVEQDAAVTTTTPATVETPWGAGKSGTITTLSAPAIAGYEFTPLVNGKITGLGTNASAGTYQVNLYAGSTLSSVSITTNTSGAFVYKALSTPVAVTAGTTYTVAVVLPTTAGTLIGRSFTNVPVFPRVYGNVRIERSVAANNTTNSTLVSSRPTVAVTNMAGAADVMFQPN